MTSRLKPSKEDTINVLRAYDDNFSELERLEESRTLNPSAKTYTATYSSTSAPSPESSPSSRSEPIKKLVITLASTSRSLDTLESLHKTIRTNTPIPPPTLLKRDDTASLIPYPYVLCSHPAGVPLGDLYLTSSSFSENSNPLSDPDKTRLILKAELLLGAFTKSLHERVQNDWFGLPGEDDENKREWGECYSWQEGFTLLLEGVLEEVGRLLDSVYDGDKGDVEIPTKDIHRHLSRAIGSFLFDDVEVPSLISHPSPSSSDWISRIFVSVPPSSTSTPADSGPETINANTTKEGEEIEPEPEVTAFLGWESSLWGDPLLEGCFASTLGTDPEWTSGAFLEGYASTPIILPRHRTKRLWYDLYAALRELVVFLSEGGEGENENEGGKRVVDGDGVEGEKRRRTKERIGRIREIVGKLENAPCY